MGLTGPGDLHLSTLWETTTEILPAQLRMPVTTWNPNFQSIRPNHLTKAAAALNTPSRLVHGKEKNHIYRMRDGLIAETWSEPSFHDLMAQLMRASKSGAS